MSGVEIVMGVMAVAGAAVSAAGSIQQGNAAKAAADFNAQVARQQADREREIAQRQAEDHRREQGRLLASSRALRAGSGVTYEGTPLLVDEATAAEIELGARTIVAGGAARATRLEQQATLQRFKGRNAQRAGYIGAGTTLLTGASTVLGRFGGGTEKVARDRFGAPVGDRKRFPI